MIEFSCPICGVKMKVPDGFAGRSGKCPQCGERCVAPSANSTVGSNLPPQPKRPPRIQRTKPPKRQIIEWTCFHDGEELGLFSTAKVIEMLKMGTLDDTTEIWREGLSEWMSIRSQIEFANISPTVMVVEDRPKTSPSLQSCHTPNSSIVIKLSAGKTKPVVLIIGGLLIFLVLLPISG